MAAVRRRPQRTPAPRTYRLAVAVLRPPLRWLTSQDWSGAEHLPSQGGFIVAVNHLSEIDPFTVAHFLVDNGCPPMFLAKSSLFDIPVFGRALRPLGQVPVYRNSRRAGEALAEAEEAVAQGKCVVIMPEGTLTREPSLWPMRGRTGVGRLALATRAPVIPVGQWGPQHLLAPYARRPTGLFSRHTMRIKAGPAVDLADLYGRAGERSAMAEASDRVMHAVVEQVGQLRGEVPPERLWERPRGDGAGSGS
jgi:1-acyl-sn-glycerol-3-phosphate acyltransferase